MRVVCIEPRNPRTHVFSAFRLPRLAMPLLGTILRNRGHEVRVFLEEWGEVDWRAVREADLVLISTITPTAERAYALADRIRREWHKPVVLGGPHATFLPDEALEHADFVIRGEGEKTVVELVEVLSDGGGFETVPGLSFRRGEERVHNPPRQGFVDLDELPVPDFRLVPGVSPERMRIYPTMTSRGCPYGCVFCSVIAMFGRKYRYRSTELVLEEISGIQPGQHVFFYDDNFAAHPERTKELLEGMIRQNFRGVWSSQVRIDVYRDREMLDLMKRSRCFVVYIGLESVNPETLKAFRKGITFQEIEEGVRAFHRYGIRVHGMFVIGADTDTEETIRATLDFARKVHLDSAQFLVLTPIPGSKLFRQFEEAGRIFDRRWDLYDGHHVVFHPRNLSPLRLMELSYELHRRFYSLSEALRRLLRGDRFGAYIAFMGRKFVRRWRKENEEEFAYLSSLTAASAAS
ncbi:B12-binding domain-containing radical SAM protein [Thermosulfurimonas sp. F29]|uniref:B12-binding domain-containing radical SAM protein n=1 Tax=Thermosulfurimonas sp. F29 TaxID=2867247 RepID=UPI001C82DF6E|nr:radical SAM protein [Thermosulfurimonas sp. F29]MBX6423672.1 B12-binding domain-containing radical SAM protein [Thermosulfurimonas sp. F29]